MRDRSIRALVAGLLIAASLPPWGWWPLSFVGIAIWASVEARTKSARRRFALGTIAGLGWFVPGLAWMWFLTAPGYVIAALLFALAHGLASAVAVRRDDPWTAVLAPVAHTLIEVVRLAFPFGGVPLATLGIAQVAGPLHRTAAIGGVVLLTWLTWQIGELLSPVARRALRAEGRARVVVGAVIVVWLAGFVAPRGSDTNATIRVAAVQGGGPQGTRAVDTDPRDVVERHLAATRAIEDEDLDLVVWPENVVDVADFGSSVEISEIASESRRLDAPFSVGITEDVDAQSFTNAQVMVDGDGIVESRYDKVRRVPFGEYMPLRSLLRSLGAPVDLVPRDAVAGTGPAVLAVDDGLDAAVVISWEVFFGGRAREGVREGGAVLVNPTNGSSYTWTILQTQQIASSRLRAVETGRWVVQVAPTGFSAFVSPAGEVHQRTAVSEQEVIVREIPLRSGSTVYTALGDRPFIAALAGFLGLGLGLRRRTSGAPRPRRRA